MTICADLNGRILLSAYIAGVIINVTRCHSQKSFNLNDNYMFSLPQKQIWKCGLEREVEFK